MKLAVLLPKAKLPAAQGKLPGWPKQILALPRANSFFA